MRIRIINEDELVLRYRWGSVDAESLAPGFHVLWPGNKAIRYDNTEHSIIIDDKSLDSELPGISAYTRDDFLIGLQVNVRYLFDRNKAIDLLKTYGIGIQNLITPTIKN